MIRHSGWNLLGQTVPLAAALVSIPILIHRIGDSRFGFLSIAWMLVGYFSLFDLGISRALTHGISRRWSEDDRADVTDLVWTGLLTLLGIGLLASAVIVGASGWIATSFINVEPELQGEATLGLIVLAGAIPFVILTAGLRGILEARQDFRAINLALMPLGVLLYVGPVLVSLVSTALPLVVTSLLVVRMASFLALFVQCARTVDGFLRVRTSRSSLRDLLSLGGWMTVSNTVSPIMVNMDRLFIGARLSLATVTYYVTPFEIVSKLLVLSGAVASASFPEFSRLAGREERQSARRYFLVTSLTLASVLVPASLLAAYFAHDVLRLWVSAELADRSALIMQLLAAGMVINGLSSVPFAYVQGAGRADVTAKFHLLELALYLPLLFFCLARFGITGAAIAWVTRVSIDAALLFGFAALDLWHRPGSRADVEVTA